jgi:cytochrome c oxidase subunit 2
MRWLALLLVLAAGCSGPAHQSALHPAGVQAGRIHSLWLLYLTITALVYVAVMGMILVAFFRPRRSAEHPLTAPPLGQELRLGIAVTAAVAVTVVLLFVLLLGDFLTGRGIDALDREGELQRVKVTGHQWWWEVRYEDPTPSNVFTTANEIHLPLGRAVHFELQAADVIHSFWVPNPHGKTDLIPGYSTRTTIRADREGTFWGQCAEFCGHQHANMRFLVVIEPEDDFKQWMESQRRPAPEPATEAQKAGQKVFLGRTCVMCHTIGGTPAQSRVGPDLTHLASRQRIAAGTLPNQRGHLAGWVADPQGVKPGVRMPVAPLAPGELQPLLDYLESLK